MFSLGIESYNVNILEQEGKTRTLILTNKNEIK